MSEWISVEERLPKDRQLCIVVEVYHTDTNVLIGEYHEGFWGTSGEYFFHIYNEIDYQGITHWMPVPSLPGETDK